MKKITFQCDMCHYSFDINDLVGFEFSGNDELVVKDANNVNRHWCIQCASAVEKMVATNLFHTFASRSLTK